VIWKIVSNCCTDALTVEQKGKLEPLIYATKQKFKQKELKINKKFTFPWKEMLEATQNKLPQSFSQLPFHLVEQQQDHSA
jgi:hypothetical protein